MSIEREVFEHIKNELFCPCTSVCCTSDGYPLSVSISGGDDVLGIGDKATVRFTRKLFNGWFWTPLFSDWECQIKLNDECFSVKNPDIDLVNEIINYQPGVTS